MKDHSPSADSATSILSRNPLLPIAVAAALGILLADRFAVSLWVSLLSMSGLFFLAAVPRAHRSALWLLSLTAATFATLHLYRLDIQDRFPFADLLEEHSAISVTATGLVTEEPRALDRVDRHQYTLRLDQISSADQSARTSHLIVIEQPGPAPAYGDRINISGNLQPIRPARNPGEFSLEYFFSRKGIVAELYVFTPNAIELLEQGKGNPFYELALKCRKWIHKTITRDLSDSPDVSAVLAAMVLGDRQNTPPEIENRFRHSGALHIFAVSGLHVGIFGTIIWTFLRIFGIRRQTAVLLIIPCLFFYAYVTGLRPSAFRAAIMASIFLSGFIFARQPRLLNSLAAAGLIILAHNSQQLFLPGFQLSFAVLAFIALLARPIQLPFRRWTEPDPFLPRSLVPAWRRGTARIGNRALDLASVSVAAWIGSAPLGLWHFNLVTPIAIIANCFLVPLAGVVLMLATLSLLTAGIGLTSVSVLFNNANWLTAKTLLVSTSAFASIPGSHFYVDHSPTWRRDECSITVLDTGLGGSSSLITFSNPQSNILVDAGGRNTYFKSVLPFLRGDLHAPLDGAVVTHGDAQHLAGMIPLLDDYTPKVIYQSALKNRSPYYKDLTEKIAALAAGGPSMQTLVAGDVIYESPSQDQSLRVLYPPAEKRHDRTADDQCVVLQLSCRSWRILFMSDSGFIAEKWLLENTSPDRLRSDILIKGQHRSDFTGLPEFLNTVAPQFIIATNFQYPAEEQIPNTWRRMLASKNIQLLDQSRTGAVIIRAKEDRISLLSYLTQETATVTQPRAKADSPN